MCCHALLAWQDACYREEVSALHGPEEDHSHDRHVGSIHNAGGKYLIQLPAIGWVEGFTRPFAIVMIVPETIQQLQRICFLKKQQHIDRY